jgi:hypothetical protein
MTHSPSTSFPPAGLLRRLTVLLAGAALVLVIAPFGTAQAVPAFARQTGMKCVECHMSWLELTSTGRRFKLGGYQITKSTEEGEVRPLVTLGFDDPAPLVPLAFAVQGGVSSSQNTHAGTAGQTGDFPRDGDVILQQASVFLAGKLVDHVGCFCQWTYDGIAKHASIDNTEIRYANEYSGNGLRALYGVSVNNNPGMSDIFNTTPVWGWPYITSSLGVAPNAQTLINGGLAQSVIGTSAYALVNRTLYLEVGGYGTSSGVFSVMHAGNPLGNRSVLDGAAPYYRLALQQDWDESRQSAEVGLFGLDAHKYPDAFNPVGPADHFVDTAVDAQYQYITDLNRASAMFTYISERQTLDGTYAGGGSSNLNDGLNQLSTKFSYYYELYYGVSVGYQRTRGSTDQLLYNTGDPLGGSASGSPNTSARILEFDYLLPSLAGPDANRTTRLVLQYTAYTRFDGAAANYSGAGRSARDNNVLYLALWALW